ncbi:hypothetical protein B0H13DRAFT_1656087 [Mycena leptocephala]|nr:hypothetical protein B0H13DRAFT_1656087 [Mycena leptocephala]
MSCLQTTEDRGWIKIANKEPLRALASELKARTGLTMFEDGDPGTNKLELEGRAGATLLANNGCRDLVPRQISFETDPAFTLRGAKLQKLTQAIAYAGIKERKAPVLRKSSVNNISQVITAIKNVLNYSPTSAQVWKSIRHKDFTRQVKNFLWKSLHSAHRIGAFWKHIPDCEERAICQFCNEPEDLEHILLKCKRPGQDLVWKLAKDLWLRKHPIWPELSLGSVLGCGLVTISDEKGRTLPGASRLYRILISESIFVIWKIRNDSVIGQGGEPIPDNKIHNKWLHAINLRLKFDCVLTNHTKYGKQNSIKTSLVLQTWSSTLADEDKLPENWIREPKVLVGTEPPSSYPAPQPSGRRGRNR